MSSFNPLFTLGLLAGTVGFWEPVYPLDFALLLEALSITAPHRNTQCAGTDFSSRIAEEAR